MNATTFSPEERAALDAIAAQKYPPSPYTGTPGLGAPPPLMPQPVDTTPPPGTELASYRQAMTHAGPGAPSGASGVGVDQTVANPPSGASGVGVDQTVANPSPVGAQSPPPPPVAPPQPQVTSTSGRTVQQGVQFSPETLAAQHAADQSLAAGGKAQLAAIPEAQRARHAQAAADFAAAGVAAADQRQEVSRADAELARRRVAIDQGADDLAKQKVDPNHYWASKSTGARIALAIGSALGAAGASLSHGPNFAGEMIQHAIDADLHAQESNIQGKRDALAQQGHAYSIAKQASDDKLQQNQAARTMMLAASAKLAQDRADQASDPIERAKALELVANIQQRTADAHAKLDAESTNKVTTHTSSSSTSGGPTAAQGGGVPMDRVVKGPDGRMYLAADAKGALEIQKSSAAAAAVAKDIARIKALRGSGGQFPMGDTHAQLSAAVADLRGHWMDMHQKLMPPEMLKQQADDMIGSPDSWTDWHAPARLDALQQGLNGTIASDLQAYGATPLDAGNIATNGGRVIYQTPTIADVTPRRGKK